MGALTEPAASIVPELIKTDASDNAGTTPTGAAKALTEASGETNPTAVEERLAANRAGTADQVKLAQVAFDDTKVQNEYGDKRRQSDANDGKSEKTNRRLVTRTTHTISTTELVTAAIGVSFSAIASNALFLGPAIAETDFASKTSAFYGQTKSSANEISRFGRSDYDVARVTAPAPRPKRAGIRTQRDPVGARTRCEASFLRSRPTATGRRRSSGFSCRRRSRRPRHGRRSGRPKVRAIV